MKKRMSERNHRRNLELMYQNYSQLMVMLANVALIAIVMGMLAYWQIGGTVGITILTGMTIFVIFLFIWIRYTGKKVVEIGEELGIRETVKWMKLAKTKQDR